MDETSTLADDSRRLASAAYAKVSANGDLGAAEDILWQAGRSAARPTPESAIAASSAARQRPADGR